MEFQARSGLPHLHSIGWRSLPPAIASLLGKLQSGNCAELTREALAPLLEVAVGAITVTSSPARLLEHFPLLTQDQAKRAATLASALQWHKCTSSCTTIFPEGQQCQLYFPQLPSCFNIIAVRPQLRTREEEQALCKVECLHQRIQQLLRDHPPLPGHVVEEEPAEELLHLLRRMDGVPCPLPNGGWNWFGITWLPCSSLDQLLVECGELVAAEADKVLLALWHHSLLVRRHAKFIPRRRVCEVFLAKYNPWAIIAMQANMEIDLISHTPEALERYVTKGSEQLSLHSASDELEERGSRQERDAAERLREEVRAGRREVSMAEAFHLLDPWLQVSALSPTKVTFVSFNVRDDGQLVDNQKRDWYNLRPAAPAPEDKMTLCQLLLWFREERRGMEEQVASHHSQARPLKIITSDDALQPLNSSNLPQVQYYLSLCLYFVQLHIYCISKQHLHLISSSFQLKLYCLGVGPSRWKKAAPDEEAQSSEVVT